MHRFIETIKFVCAVLYSVYLKLSNRRPLRIVIFYHSVKTANVHGFRKQMKYLSNKCTVVSPLNIKTAHANGTRPVVAITFDDAFVSVIDNAVPSLRKYKLPAGISVPTGNLEQPPRWEFPDNWCDKNEIIMGAEQIIKLDEDGFEILSHTVSHPFLTRLNGDRLHAELVQSKQVLERIVGHEIAGICYPQGDRNDTVCQIARDAGYKLGFTIDPRPVNITTDDMQIGRFEVSPRDSLTKFKLKVKGAYQVESFLIRLKQFLLKNLLLRGQTNVT